MYMSVSVFARYPGWKKDEEKGDKHVSQFDNKFAATANKHAAKSRNTTNSKYAATTIYIKYLKTEDLHSLAPIVQKGNQNSTGLSAAFLLCY